MGGGEEAGRLYKGEAAYRHATVKVMTIVAGPTSYGETLQSWSALPVDTTGRKSSLWLPICIAGMFKRKALSVTYTPRRWTCQPV